MIGKRVLHYKITEELGRGGMGVVYKAEDTKLRREVALKFLPTSALQGQAEKNRFTREAQAAAALNHTNIAHIYAIEEFEGQMFLAMEFIDGSSIAQIVAGATGRSPLPLDDAINYATQIAAGLQAAHEKGIVHRDIKSANIMVTGKGVVKIMDFGLAKLVNRSKMTIQGSTLGTAAYMSPEQARGQELDHRSDIWSFGVVLYEMVSGRLPFKGEYEQAVIYSILNEEPEPLTALRSGLPIALDGIIAKALAKDPDTRYQHVDELPADLRAISTAAAGASRMTTRISTAAPPQPPKAPTSRRSRIPWILLAMMALLMALALWAPWRTAPPAPLPMRFNIDLPEGRMLEMAQYTAVAVSADGTQLVYRANEHLYLRRIDRLVAEEIPGTVGGASPFFSPDGRWLGFFAGGKLKKVLLDGGIVNELADAEDNRGGTWSPDGTIIFTPATTVGLMSVPDGGGAVKAVTTLDTAKNERTHRWPYLLPDGKTVLFTVGTLQSPDYYEDATIEAVNLKTGQRTILVKNASSARYAPPGYLLYSCSGVLFAAPFDADHLRLTGKAAPVIPDLNGDITSGAMNFCFSENGLLAYIAGKLQGSLRMLTLLDQKGTPTVLSAPFQPYWEPRLSPDGRRLAVVITTNQDQDVWVFDLERGTLARLTFGGNNRTPTWSPDGRRIAYWSHNNGDPGIFIKQADGSGDTQAILSGTGRTYINCWSRDGSVLILDHLTVREGSNLEILPMKEGAQPQELIATRFDEYAASLSPDGKWLAYLSNESGAFQVYVQPFPSLSGKWQISTDGANEPRWSPDGRTLYFRSSTRMMAAAITTRPSFAAGKPRVLFDGYRVLSVDSDITYDITPDGQSFVTVTPQTENNPDRITVMLNWLEEMKRLSTVAD